MPVVFPPLHTATPEGLLAVGGDLSVETLLVAYKQGIFPWPISSDSPLTWFSPDPRGILNIEKFHISKSFQRFLKKSPYTINFNQNFPGVIEQCALTKRKHEKGTWISEEIIEGYTNLFDAGYAYCVEVYEEDMLVGGLYGTCIGEIISGESMFHHADNASKVALCSLVEILKRKNIKWLDTQMVTPIVESFGGEQIPRVQFVTMLQKLNPDFPNREELFQLD